jgi:hypothetical protein
LVGLRDVEGLAEAIMKILSNDKFKKQSIEGGLATIRRIKENESEKLLSKLIFKKLEVR